MSLVRKYDKTLRRRTALRAVWLPGTEVRVGDIMLLKDGALISVGNLKSKNIPYKECSIGEAQSINLQSSGVSKTLMQNGVKVSVDKLDTSANAELKISFNDVNSYFLRTPVLSGTGLENAMGIAKKIAEIPGWDHLRNYVVHKIWRAEDFVFLGNLDRNAEITFSAKGDFIKKILNQGVSSGVNKSSDQSMNLEVMGTSGPVVMQVFRVKRNGDIY